MVTNLKKDVSNLAVILRPTKASVFLSTIAMLMPDEVKTPQAMRDIRVVTPIPRRYALCLV